MLQLHKMLDICFECGKYLDIVFNAKKSTLFVTDKIVTLHLKSYILDKIIISLSHSLKYLAVIHKSAHTVVVDVVVIVRKFYAFTAHAQSCKMLQKCQNYT